MDEGDSDRAVTEREKERKIEETKRTKAKAAFMFIFLSSLVFSAGAIGGFIIVGQMLKDTALVCYFLNIVLVYYKLSFTQQRVFCNGTYECIMGSRFIDCTDREY